MTPPTPRTPPPAARPAALGVPASSAAAFPGPDALGRGVVLDARGASTAGRAPAAVPLPAAFAGAPRVRIDEAALADPAPAIEVLHAAWLARRRVVVELAVDTERLREPESTDAAPHEVGPGHTFLRERLAFLVWANAWDLRDGTPRWWHGELAVRRAGCRPLAPGVAGDVALSDGRAVWIDGGPRGPLAVAITGADALPLVHRESVTLLGRATVVGDGPPSGPLAARLTPDQAAAVTHRVGPARIIAPAGSGKTRVLAARLAHLITDRHVEPELVTAVAYNTRAADELRERVAGVVGGTARGGGRGGPAVRTLHSLALSVVRLEGEREVIDERAVRTLLGQLVRLPRVANQDAHAPWLEALTEARLGLADPVRIEQERGDVDGFPEVFDRYRALLADRGLADFDEQVHRALELLLTRPDLRRTAQVATTHLLVDEFQDLTPAFVLLVRLLAGPAMQVFAVGDDDQTIYGYAGADPRFLVDFDRWFPGAAHHALEVNFRCPPAVVAAASTLLGHNRVRVAKTIRAGLADDAPRADGAVPGTAAAGTATPGVDSSAALTTVAVGATEVAHHVVARVRERLADGTAPGSVAVLARVNATLLPVQVALAEVGVGSGAPLGPEVLRRTGIRTALAYLRIATDPERPRREDLDDTLRRPARKLRTALEPLLAATRAPTRADLVRFRRRLTDDHRERLDRYLADLDALARALAGGADTATLLAVVRDRIGLGEAMDALDASRRRPEGSSHGDDLDALAQVAALEPDPRRFRRWLTDRLEVAADPDGVVLSTVHRVKGMEWDHVLVVGADTGRLPHRLAEDVEEERRVFHVAITRARRSLTVVSDAARTSPFVAELTRPAPPATSAPSAPTGRSARTERDGRSGTGRPGRTARAGTAVAAADAGAADEALVAALKAWRLATARREGVPAYLVMNDRTLQAIAARRPGDLRALATCPGIGPMKLERFGDELLATVADQGPGS